MKKPIKIIIITLSAVIVLLTAVSLVIMHLMLDHHIDYYSLYTGEEFGIEAKEQFVKTEDGLNIAIYELEAQDPKAVILTLSGIEKPSGTAFMGHAAMFQKHNYSTIMIEMRAHGHSDGDKICLGYKETMDVGAVLNYAKTKYPDIPIIIMGLSMGAGTAINSIAEYPEIDALISLSAFSSCEKTFSEIVSQTSDSNIAGAIMEPFLNLGTFLRYGSSVSKKPIKSIKALNGRPALLMHTTEDSNVSYANFLRLKEVAPDNVVYYSFEGDEHFITPEFLNPEKDQRYSNIILDFINSVL